MNSSFDEYDEVFLENDEAEDEGFGDPCHELEHSVVFFIILFLCIGGVVFYCVLLLKKRVLLTGFDILYLLLFSCTLIRFGPKMWGALQVHGIRHASQTGCKLVAFTEFGLSPVHAFLVGCLVVYAWEAARGRRDERDLGRQVRQCFPWLLLVLFLLEGVTGMVPAIFTDVNDSGNKCDFGRSDELTLAQFLAIQIVLSTLLPYILPFLCMVYPLYLLSKKLLDVEDKQTKSTVRNILIVAWSYYLLSLPWALHALVMLPLMQGWKVGLDAVNICIVDGVFRLKHDFWYALVPFIIICGDDSLGKGFPGAKFAAAITDELRRVVRTAVTRASA